MEDVFDASQVAEPRQLVRVCVQLLQDTCDLGLEFKSHLFDLQFDHVFVEFVAGVFFCSFFCVQVESYHLERTTFSELGGWFFTFSSVAAGAWMTSLWKGDFC